MTRVGRLLLIAVVRVHAWVLHPGGTLVLIVAGAAWLVATLGWVHLLPDWLQHVVDRLNTTDPPPWRPFPWRD